LIVSNICLSNLSLNTLSALLYESTERANQEKIKNSGKMPTLDFTELILVLLHRVASPHHHHSGCSGHQRHHQSGPTPSIMPAAPIPFPRPVSLPADGTLGPRRLSMGSSRSAVCYPRLRAMGQLGCTSAWALIIGSTGGGGERRRNRRAPSDLGGHQPCTSIIDPPDGKDLHLPTGPTPRTTRVEEHHTTHLANSFPYRASAVDASINRSSPVELWYATGSQESVWQPGHGTRRPGQVVERRW
jgi:hypothetical protein